MIAFWVSLDWDSNPVGSIHICLFDDYVMLSWLIVVFFVEGVHTDFMPLEAR